MQAKIEQVVLKQKDKKIRKETWLGNKELEMNVDATVLLGFIWSLIRPDTSYMLTWMLYMWPLARWPDE